MVTPRSRRKGATPPPAQATDLPAELLAENPQPARHALVSTLRERAEDKDDGLSRAAAPSNSGDRNLSSGATAPVRLGSYGVRSIDQHDPLFLAASDAVFRKNGVRVNPRFMKAVMGVESGNDGTYPVDRCRPYDGHPGPLSCGPMQIKYDFHKQRCPECDNTTLAGHIELATHIIGDTMKAKGGDEYAAYTAAYLTADDINGTSQSAAVARLKQSVAAMERDAGVAPSDPWRPYPYPKMVDLIVEKPVEGRGFDRVAFRRPLIRGFCTHITDGPGTQRIEDIAAYFSTGGAWALDALTDLVLGQDGRIGLLNDWRDPQRGGTRAGWANGGVDGIEGEGVAFYRSFPDINVRLVSAEHCAKDGERWSDAMIASSIEIRTPVAQELKCPAESYPYHPTYGGVSIEQQHRNFATKSCPASPYISSYDAVVRREEKAKLAAWQGGSATAPPPVPVKTYSSYGLTLETVSALFGVMQRFNQDGSVDDLPFNPKGPLSLLWLKRAEEREVFPEAESMQVLDTNLTAGQEWLATWEGGWVAVLPAGETRANWRWLDEAKEAA